MATKALIIGAVAVLGGAVALRSLAAPGPAPAAPGATDVHESAAAQPRVASPPQLPAIAAAPALPDHAPSAPAIGAPTDDGAAAVARQREHLEARFTAEQADARWAPGARSAITDDLGRLSVPGAALRGVECRATMCRAELALGEPGAGAAFMQTWLRQRQWNGPGFAVNTSDATMVVYLGKIGGTLPLSE
jgi:hypothetical protein